MKRIAIFVAVACLLPLVLSGCASLNSAGGHDEVDEARMALIQRVAVLHGVKVVWVNPPTKKVAQVGG